MSNQTQLRAEVRKGENIVLQGSNSTVKVAGDVWGRIAIEGSNGEVRVGGTIRPGAVIIIQGSNATLKHHGKDPGARVTLQGSNAEEIDLSPPSYRRRSVFLDSVLSATNSVEISGIRPNTSLSIINDRVFIDGQEFTDIMPAIPAPTKPRGSVTVQKSYRPRELWGT